MSNTQINPKATFTILFVHEIYFEMVFYIKTAHYCAQAHKGQTT